MFFKAVVFTSALAAGVLAQSEIQSEFYLARCGRRLVLAAWTKR